MKHTKYSIPLKYFDAFSILFTDYYYNGTNFEFSDYLLFVTYNDNYMYIGICISYLQIPSKIDFEFSFCR